ncbi:putative serine/threonine-protein kinase DDB [Sesamum alatum]|uniref:Serine/threonine-protein kinase DDB n=1 Tax=Sesamum alatum TaxID=300844 RepID=A0AAE1Y861_9LAMI|nr:putative serine/threonine-protein kinase DDB [Sesamum alatum]
MKSEPCGCAGQQCDGDSAHINPDDQNFGNKSLHNISVQTGEEFSPEFLRDRVMSRRTHLVKDVDPIPVKLPAYDVVQNHHLVHEDLTGFLGIRRRDPEMCLEFSDFSPSKGYLDGQSRYYREFQVSRHQRRFSDDIDRGSPYGPPIYSLDSPLSYQPCGIGSVFPDSSFCRNMKFLCSFGGKILPRPSDGKLRYVGGETRIISIRKNLTYFELVNKTTAIWNHPHTIRYQLPGEDLDALISVSSDEDLHHMIEEYHDLERTSQRLRLFLVSSGDPEGSCSLEARTIQQTDADYQYVVAVNSMVEPSHQRSSSRESLVSHWGSNVDGSSTPQRESPTFHHLEKRNGGSALSHKVVLPSPSAQVFNAPQLPSKSYIPSLVPIKDPKISYMKGYEDVTCQDGYEYASPYAVDSPAYESPYCVDATGYYMNHPIDTMLRMDSPNMNNQMVESHGAPILRSHFRKPSADFESPSRYGPGDFSESRGLPNAVPLHSEKLVPPQHTVNFFPLPNVQVESHKKATHLFSGSQQQNEENAAVSSEERTDKSPMIFAMSSSSQEVLSQEKQIAHEEYKMYRNKDQHFEESLYLKKERIKTKETSTKQDARNQAVINDYASNADLLECKRNLAKIICQPDLSHGFHVGPSKSQLNGGKSSVLSSNCLEDTTEAWKDNYQVTACEPEFLIKSQKAADDQKHRIPHVIDSNTVHGCHRLQSIASEEKPGMNSCKKLNISNSTLVQSQSSDKCHKTGIQEVPVVVEDVTGCLTHEAASCSTAIPHVQDEQIDGIESHREETEAESGVPESDSEDLKVDEDDKDKSISEAAIIEMEAGIYGLQIIRNADLEDLQELGSGTFGTVYHGKWRGTDVAIKRIKKSCFAGRSSEQDRLTKDFWREAQILSKLHHPNVVAFYGVVPDGPGGTLATVTEFMANGSLRHVLLRKDRALDRRKKVMLALDAAFGMEYLHLRNIVHFDLKCDNLLVNLGDPQRPVCKVGDFGLSRIKQNTLVSGGVRGTLPWMAPELLNGSSSRVSERVDIFSFGIAMWEIIAGDEPYANMHCGAIIGGIVNNTLRPPVPERCDPEWRKLMEECWSHDPDARPTFTEITNRLQVMSKALQPKRFNRVKR